MKRVHFTLFILALLISGVYAQQPSSSAEDVFKALDIKEQMMEGSIVKNVAFENVGPSVMSGRVTDLAVNPDDPTEFYVGYASGGVWHT
ncbi:MAG: hypothetical protein KJO25_07165, partial [Bacteroidia bacterium]|nr:hypothetical protein [Bacteroidia bacterium]